jgi:hypothetical protein
MSNHNYKSVKETMQEIGIDESYIGKTLKLYGLEEFPKSGLNDRGLSKLVKTATDIAHSEESLTTIKPKKGYLPAPKIEEGIKLKKIMKNRNKIDISGILWEITKKISIPLPTLITALGTGYFFYQKSKDLGHGVIVGLFTGAGVVMIHGVIRDYINGNE